jgi:hypothetical protein
MKKFLTLALLLCMTITVYAQKRLEEYTASNGVTYKVGDQIKMGLGSDPSGKYNYLTVGGWGVSLDREENKLPSIPGLVVTIKKIKEYDTRAYKGVSFTVGGGNITNYVLDIEGAIRACELEECDKNSGTNTTSSDKYDKLKKLKTLYDEGVLSEEEYEAEKAKILGNK